MKAENVQQMQVSKSYYFVILNWIVKKELAFKKNLPPDKYNLLSTKIFDFYILDFWSILVKDSFFIISFQTSGLPGIALENRPGL